MKAKVKDLPYEKVFECCGMPPIDFDLDKNVKRWNEKIRGKEVVILKQIKDKTFNCGNAVYMTNICNKVHLCSDMLEMD